MKKIIKKNRKQGFVMLFAVTISAILLSIALGVANIALKEVKFSSSARDTNDAFFAADTGIEYTLYHDRASINSYPAPSLGTSQSWPPFVITGLGSTGLSCANVSITKNNIASPMTTTIISKGYNIGNALCNSSNPDRIERELRTTY